VAAEAGRCRQRGGIFPSFCGTDPHSTVIKGQWQVLHTKGCLPCGFRRAGERLMGAAPGARDRLAAGTCA